MHGKPVKYSHVKGILQCTKMQEFTMGLIDLIERRKGALNGETRRF